MKKSSLAVATLLAALSVASITPIAYADDTASQGAAPAAGCSGCAGCSGSDTNSGTNTCSGCKPADANATISTGSDS